MMRWTLLLVISIAISARAAQPMPARGGSKQPVQDSRCNDVPAHPLDLILGRPTASSVTISVLCYKDTDGNIAYGTTSGNLTQGTARRLFKAGAPAEIVLSGLAPNTRYFYQFRAEQVKSAQFTFHTARPPGSSFTFTITADSHLDTNTDPAIYQATLASALADKPDFHIDLGDTFMTEKHANRESAARQYLAQRYYFGQLSTSSPLFLALGNHDGESPSGRGGDSLAVWSSTMRKQYFPNPLPDAFYTGNANRHPEAGLLQDYYAWEWGDALFVVLDPYWFNQRQLGREDNWSRSLGAGQFEWLRKTLERSRAKSKFVFIHQLVGGIDNQGRGGIGVAQFYEWGGKNADGSDGFKQHRPGWPMPIHQMLVQNHVSVVFHGHDHFYAKQELDGIVYEEVPQPGRPGDSRVPRSAAEYGYTSGVMLGGSGHLRVAVAPAKVCVEYVRSQLVGGATAQHPSGQVVHAYELPEHANAGR